MKRVPRESQACYVPDIRAIVEIVQADADGDPFFMEHDDLIRARHVGIEHAATWSARRLRPLTPLAREMMRAARGHRKRG